MALFELYVPLILSVLLIVATFKLKINQRTLFTFRPPMLEITIPITSIIFCRTVLVFLAMGSLYYYFVMDFSHFFPERYEMDVFYDESGLRQKLTNFTDAELTSLGYSPEIFSSRTTYFQEIDKKLNNMLHYDGFFSLSEGTIHSHGETLFRVRKKSGFHNYCITESKGELSHMLERPNAPTISLKSFFELLPTSHDYLRPNFYDIVCRREFILQPRFKQIIAENYRSNGVLFDHTLVGVTKVRLFPVPSFDSTIYFVEVKGKGLVPVAYGVYTY